MSTEDRVTDLFERARRITDPGDRSRFLDEACSGDTTLRSAIDQRFSTTEFGGGDFFFDDGLPSENAGDCIGRYRLVETLGEGGFGTVWLAEQSEPVRRSVALKIIKLGMDTRQVVARFEQERQALALMDHANVARVLDAGATDSGRPYFVMDLVRGESITTYCDRRHSTVKERLGIFVQACAALRHAHGKGIIHRDIKPSNILVGERDGRGHATVIDFGIAKATAGRLTDQSFMTGENQIIGTLAYMSPEQVEGSMDIDTRTDVYALGVVLYELLSGELPFNPRAHRNELQRLIREEDPVPPSSRVRARTEASVEAATRRALDARRLPELLKGDLDWIAMKALEKDRTRRYPTVDALALDIERYMRGLPVEAAPPSRVYQVRKFVRRHRGGVIAAAFVFFALFLGIVGATWGKIEADAARLRAEEATRKEQAEHQQSERVAGVLERLLRSINPDADNEEGEPGLKDQLVEAIDTAMLDLGRFADDSMTTVRVQHSLGMALAGLSEFAKAETLFRQAYESARARFGDDEPRVALAAIDLGSVLQHLGRHDEALALIDGVRSHPASWDEEFETDELAIDHMRAMILQASGRSGEAITLLEDLKRRFETGPKANPRDALLAAHNLGAALRHGREYEKAIKVLEDTLTGRSALLGADSAESMMTANSLVVAYNLGGRPEDALRIGLPLLESVRRRFGVDHQKTLGLENNLSVVYERLGRYDEALQLISEACDRSARRFGRTAFITLRLGIGTTRVELEAGQADAAFNRAKALVRPALEVFGPTDELPDKLLQTMVSALRARKPPTDPTEWFAKELSAAENAVDADSAENLRWRFGLAFGVAKSGDRRLAIDAWRKVEAAQTRILGAEDPETLATGNLLGVSLFAEKDAAAAIEVFERVVPGRRRRLGPTHIDTLRSQDSLGASYWLAKRYPDAVRVLEETVRQLDATAGPESEAAVHSVVNLAENLDASGRQDDVIAWLAPRFKAAAAAAGGFSESTLQMADLLAKAAKKTDRLGDGIEAFDFLAAYFEREFGAADRRTGAVRFDLARAASDAGQSLRALDAFGKLLDSQKTQNSRNRVQDLRLVEWMATEMREMGRPAESLETLEKGLREAYPKTGLPPEGDLQATRHYVWALLEVGRAEDASNFATKLLENRQAAADEAGVQGARYLLARCRLEAGHPEEALELTLAAESAKKPTSQAMADSLKGACLSELGRFDEAESLLESSHASFLENKGRMAIQRAAIRLSYARVLRHFERRQAATPNAAWVAQIDRWRREQDEFLQRFRTGESRP